MLNPNPPPTNPTYSKYPEEAPPSYGQATYNPGFVQPSAPPLSAVQGQGYSHDGFFGATALNQDQLGREMLGAVVQNKTEWVPKASIPSDSTFNQVLGFVGGLFPTAIDPNNLDNKMKAKLWRQAGELGFAEMLGDQALVKAAERKTDTLFQQFISGLDHDERKPEYCFTVSLEYEKTPETLFDKGKLEYLTHNYAKASESFQDAELVAKKLESSSKYRINRFIALIKSCGGAAQERLGYHDKALFKYIDAATIDPNGPKSYEESLSRNFQILKFKPNKCDEELQACMEYDPYEPDFTIELASVRLNQGQYEAALKLLNKSNELAFYYKTQALYRCLELAQQIAFCVNNSQAHYR